ncbi:MAG TPA: molybdenum cofactor guanylyltransferase [Bacteroidia bacterium]|nr:molybdenum cofactor guanylyltransferase [Bacteroidia bacterium]
MNAYILAGGKSSRMGADKGLILLNEKPMIDYVIAQLKPLCKNIFIVTNNSEYKKLGFECIEDEIKNIGPAGGIFSALKHTNTQHNLIVSCDMPFIRTKGIEYIMMHSLDHGITIPVFENHLQPMCGVYNKNILDKWQILILKDERKLQSMVKLFLLKQLVLDYNILFDANFFKNINTPEELKDAKNYFS